MTANDKALLRFWHLKTKELEIDELSVFPGEAWGIVGETGSGMDTLEAILDGNLALVSSGECILPKPLGLVSFARQQEMFERELRNDDTDYMDKPDPGTLAGKLLASAAGQKELLKLLNLEHVLDRGYRHLSSGEAMKTAIIAELGRGARLLALEHPFDGLDQASCRELQDALAKLHQQGLTLLFLLGDANDLPEWCTHLALIQDGALKYAGTLAEIRPKLAGQGGRKRALFQADVAELRQDGAGGENADTLVALRGGFARYGEVEVFSGLDFIIHPGEHTLVTGPNGCGKSTLVQLITGDHPLCYVNDLRIFGQKRGEGETIWDVKRHMGIVSGDLHRNYRAGGTALSALLSGLFDSIGLYKRPTREERGLGERWLGWLGLEHLANKAFSRLSYGEQRLIMLGRALIKKPRLLLMDEPTQGLDRANRMALLDFLEKAAAEELTTILYISHRQDEYRPFFKQHLEFLPDNPGGPFRITTS